MKSLFCLFSLVVYAIENKHGSFDKPACIIANDMVYVIGGEVDNRSNIFNTYVYTADLFKGFSLKNQDSYNYNNWKLITHRANGANILDITSTYDKNTSNIMSIKMNIKSSNYTINILNTITKKWIQDDKNSLVLNEYASKEGVQFDFKNLPIIKDETKEDDYFIFGIYPESSLTSIQPFKFKTKVNMIVDSKVEGSFNLQSPNSFIVSYKSFLYYFYKGGDKANMGTLVIYDFELESSTIKYITGEIPTFEDFKYIQTENVVYFINNQSFDQLDNENESSSYIHILNLESLSWSKERINGTISNNVSCYISYKNYLIFILKESKSIPKVIQIIEKSKWAQVKGYTSNNIIKANNTLPIIQDISQSPNTESGYIRVGIIISLIFGLIILIAMIAFIIYFIVNQYQIEESRFDSIIPKSEELRLDGEYQEKPSFLYSGIYQTNLSEKFKLFGIHSAYATKMSIRTNS